MPQLDPIGDLFKEGEEDKIRVITTALRECTEVYEDLGKKVKTMQFIPKFRDNDLRELLGLLREVPGLHKKASDSASVLGNALDEYQKLASAAAIAQTKLNVADSQAAKDAATARVALEEKNKALKSEAQLLDESFRARQEATQAEKVRQAQDQISANKMRESSLEMQKNMRELRQLAVERERLATKASRITSDPAQKQELLAEADAARQAIAGIKEYQVELRRSQVEANAAARQTEYLSSEYNKLNAEHSKLYKQARDVGAQFGIESQEFKQAAESANLLDAKLKGIDEALGNHRRSVGQYTKVWDGLGVSVQRIFQELPSLAVNMNTFLLAISNNLQPFIDEVRMIIAQQKEAKAAAEAAALTAAKLAEAEALAAGMTNQEAQAQAKLAEARALANAQGQAGVSVGLRLFKSIFSVNTLISIGVTLLTIYGSRLIDWISNVSTADKVLRDFNKGLEESADKASKEISHLTKLQYALQNANAKRSDMLDAIDELKKTYPGYFEFLKEETRLTGQVNEAINHQIDLIMRRADAEAGIYAMNEATKALVLAQQELNKESGFFERFWAARPWGSKGYDELTESARKLADEQYKLYQQGLISKDEYYVMWRRIEKVSEAQGRLREATELSIDPEQRKINEIQKEIKEQQRLVKHYQEVIDKWGPRLSGAAQQEINDRSALIEKLQEQKKAYEDARAAREKLDAPKGPIRTQAQIMLQEAETRAKLAKDGSKEELAAEQEAARAKYMLAVENLRKEYAEKYKLRQQDLAANKQYQRDLAEAEAELLDTLEKIQSRNDKKNKPKKGRKPADNTNRDLSIDNSMAELDKKFYDQQIEAAAARNKAIADDEKRSLADRLAAYDRYIQNKIDLSRASSGQELLEATQALERIEKIEEKSITTRTEQEKDLLAKKEFYNKQIELITLQQAFAEEQITAESAKSRAAIVENDAKNQIAKLQKHVDNIKAVWKKWESDELRALDQRYKNGDITIREYLRARQKVEKDARDGELEALDTWITEMRDRILNSDLPQEVKDWLENIFNSLPKSRALPANERSILDFLGFGQRSMEDARRELASQIQGLYNTIWETVAKQRDNYFQGLFDQLDRQQKEMQDTAEKEKAAIQASLLPQAEKEKKLAELEEQRLVREKQMDNARRALQRRQAIREKQDAIFQASLNAGIAISKVFAGMGTGPGAALTAIATAALIAAQTAANIASISSQPIPEYWKGTPRGGHPADGPAWIGERGPELGILPSGQRFITPGEPTLSMLPKGTHIIPPEKLVQRVNENASGDIGYYRGQMAESQGSLALDFYDRKMEAYTRNVVEAIKNKKEWHIKINGHADFTEYGPYGSKRYIGNVI